MSDESDLKQRFFTTYTGLSFPLRLTNELEGESMENRITYFIGYYDADERLVRVDKSVYGEIEFSQHYEYDEANEVCKAILEEEGEEPRTLISDGRGGMIEQQ